MPAASSMSVVASASQSSRVGLQACHAAAASSHCARVVLLKTAGSNVVVVMPAPPGVCPVLSEGAGKGLATAGQRPAIALAAAAHEVSGAPTSGAQSDG